jgi:Fe2+ or Zn2+ uptake regulation protein
MITQSTGLTPLLKSQGYSLTKPRQAVFNALRANESLSMHELIKHVSLVDRASVYRTVELYEKLGIVHRIQIGWKYKLELSDMFRDHHHHAVCTNCGQTIPIQENKDLEAMITKLGMSLHFKITSHALELRGLCARCNW